MKYIPREREKKRKPFKAFTKGFTKTFQRQTALTPEHIDFLTSILVRNLLPDIQGKNELRIT